jgi:hypothetical protein
MKHSDALLNIKKDEKENKSELLSQEKEFYLGYKKKFDYKLYEKFKSDILNKFTLHLGNKSKFINLAFGIVSCFDDFIRIFGNIIYSNFDLNNTNFEDFWIKVSVDIEDEFKQEFFKRLRKFVLENELNKSITSWKLLQYNDYKNFLHDKETKKTKQVCQKQLLDDQIRRKLELRLEAEEAIEKIAKFSCIKNKSTSEILYEQLLLHKQNKVKEEIENSILKKSLKNFYKNDNINIESFPKDNLKQDEVELPISISINNTINHFYKNANSKLNIKKKDMIADELIKDKLESVNRSTFFNINEKTDIRNSYLDIMVKQNNYRKSDKINNFDYVKDCVRLDKHMIYKLRNTSNIFFE